MATPSSLIASLLAKSIFGYAVGEALRNFKRHIYNFCGIKTQGQELEESLDNVEQELAKIREEKEKLERVHDRIDEKNAKLKEKDSELTEKEERISRFERIMRSLERKGISRREIIKKYKRSLPIILISYTKQEAPEKESFVSSAFKEKLNAKYLGGSDQVVPPEKVRQAGIDDRDSLEEWIEKEVYEGIDGRSSIIRFAAIADLRNEVFWRDDFSYDSKAGSTVGDALGIEGIIESEAFVELLDAGDKAAVEEVIREGDIGFFASRWVEESDLNSIHENQSEIEEKLGDKLGALNLRNLSSASAVDAISEVLEEYIELPEESVREVSEGIVDEANIWQRELQSWD